MLLVIPRLNIVSGKCRYEGDLNRPFKLRDPVAMSKLWRVQNAKTLVLADEESPGDDLGKETLEAILDVSETVDIPVQVDCVQHDANRCHEYLDGGVYRLIVSSDRGVGFYSDLASAYGARRVAVRLTSPEVDATAFANAGCCRFFFGIEHPNGLGLWEPIVSQTSNDRRVRYTAEGGVTDYPTLAQLDAEAPACLDSVVLGRPLYDQRFPCQASWCWNRVETVELECFSTATLRSAEKKPGTKKSPQQ